EVESAPFAASSDDSDDAKDIVSSGNSATTSPIAAKAPAEVVANIPSSPPTLSPKLPWDSFNEEGAAVVKNK
ncbi:hypothetical protein MaudMau93_008097, partial [Microsporum audouinii]